MKMKKNQKGFTLIELLAVIVILAVLLALAIPAVSKYINTAKKSTYKENVQSYAQAAKKELMNIDTQYELPVNEGDVVVITFAELKHSVENGGRKSSYGNEFEPNNSCVIVVNDGTTNDPHYTYYIAAADSKGYSIGENNGKTTTVIAYDKIQNGNIIQTTDRTVNCKAASTMRPFIVADVKAEFGKDWLNTSEYPSYPGTFKSFDGSTIPENAS